MIRAALLLLLALAACAPVPKVAPTLEPAVQARVWPQPPDPPRYAYAGTLIGEKDFIGKKTPEQARETGRNILEWITGAIFGEPRYIELQRPVTGLVDDQGRILVTDGSVGGVVVFDMAGKNVEIWNAAADGADFVAPAGIAPDGSGGIFVADAELGEVFRLDTRGDPVGSFGRGVLKRPTGLARDPTTGNLFVSDTGTHRLLVFNAKGEMLETIGARGKGRGQFNFPTHLALSGGKLYVADTLNFRIQVLDLTGDGRLAFGSIGVRVGEMTRPKGVAAGPDGRIYVVESYFDHLLVFDDKGRFLLPIGGTGAAEGQFYLPSGVWTDPQGRVYVADMFNGRVAVFKALTTLGP